MTWRTLTHRRLALVGVLALTAIGAVGGAAPAQAAACSGTNGVTVVVQREGVLSTRCASGDPSSALQAFRQVGHDLDADRSGLVCRVDGYPDTCVATVDAYWAFFHAAAGGSWQYASVGAGSYDPRPGSSVGFRFGSGSAPSVQPAAPAPKPTTAAPKPTTAAPRPTTAAPRATAAAPRTTAPSAGRGTRTATTPETAGGRGSATTPASPGPTSVRPSANGATGATGPATPERPSTSASPSASGSATPTLEALGGQDPPGTGAGSSGRLVGGGVLLLALASAVGAVALRRRAAGA